MIIEKTGVPVQTSEDFKEMNFDIKDEDKGLILEILRSKMYKNPIGSICREIASNGRDANREVGSNSPVLISISDSPFFSTGSTIVFQDEGPGISPDRMADVFVNYGSSTKRHSNEFTGGFGLGCKTPFSYTDSFCVITVVDKIQYTYIAAIEDQAKGKIYLVTKNETEEKNGTSIIVPIKEEDQDTFEDEVIRSTYFWETRPTYINFSKSIEDIEMTVLKETDQFLFVKQDFFEGSYGIVIDGVLYPIDRSLMKFANQNLDRGVFIVLKFKTGDLTISANRENLQYDEKTKTKILNKWEVFLDTISNTITDKVKNVKTAIEACVIYYGFTKSPEDTLYHFYSTFTRFRHGNLLTETFKETEFSKSLDFKTNRRSYEFSKISRGNHKESKLFYDQDFLNLPIYICDKNMPSTFRNATVLKNHEAFIAIKPNSPRLTKFRGLPYSEKKKLAKIARHAIEDFKLFKSMGMKIEKYSSIPITKLKKDPSLLAKPKEPKTRTFYCKATLLSDLSVRKTCDTILLKDGEFTLDGNQIIGKKVISKKPTEYLYVTEPSLIDFQTRTPEVLFLHNALKLKEVPNLTVLFIQKKYESFFKGTFLSVDEKVASLTESVYKKMAEVTIVRTLYKEYEILTHLSFKHPESQAAVTKLKSIWNTHKSADIQSHTTEELVLKYHKELPTYYLREQLESILNAFPLLRCIFENRYGWLQHTHDIKNYVSLVEETLILKGTL